MTVSLALRNSRLLPASTRERIHKLARARGYQTDPKLNSLMQYLRARSHGAMASNICGLIGDFELTNSPQRQFADKMLRGVEERAHKLGLAFSVFKIGAHTNVAQLRRVVGSRGIEGVIVMPQTSMIDMRKLLDWDQMSVVSTTTMVSRPRFRTVLPDHFRNAQSVCQLLADSGRNRIGLAMTDHVNDRTRQSWTAAVAWHSATHGTKPVPFYLENAEAFPIRQATLLAWLRKHRPEAIICGPIDPSLWRDLNAESAFKSLVTAWHSAGGEPDIQIDERPEIVAAVAVDELVGMISRGERGISQSPTVTLVEGEIRRLCIKQNGVRNPSFPALPKPRAVAAALPRSVRGICQPYPA